jgi:hypothetical protein
VLYFCLDVTGLKNDPLVDLSVLLGDHINFLRELQYINKTDKINFIYEVSFFILFFSHIPTFFSMNIEGKTENISKIEKMVRARFFGRRSLLYRSFPLALTTLALLVCVRLPGVPRTVLRRYFGEVRYRSSWTKKGREGSSARQWERRLQEQPNEVDAGVKQVLVVCKFVLLEQFDIEYGKFFIEVEDPAKIGISNIF